MSQQSIFPEQFPHMPDANEIAKNINTQAYAPVPFALGRASCSELFDSFRNFVDLCAEPNGEQLVEALTFTVNDKGNGSYFLNYRRPGEVNPHEKDRAPGKDHKYIYHHGVHSLAHAKTRLGKTLPQEMADFLVACEEMYEAGRKAAKIGASALGLEGILFSGYRGDDVHHLRLIDYVASDEPLLGDAHFDRSVATLAISESHTGLRGVPGQNGKLQVVDENYIEELRNNLRPINHFEYEAKFFLAAGANRLSTPDRAKIAHMPLLGHDITNNRPGESRQSVVMFLNPHNQFPGYIVPTKYETGFDDIIAKIRRNQKAS